MDWEIIQGATNSTLANNVFWLYLLYSFISLQTLISWNLQHFFNFYVLSQTYAIFHKLKVKMKTAVVESWFLQRQRFFIRRYIQFLFPCRKCRCTSYACEINYTLSSAMLLRLLHWWPTFLKNGIRKAGNLSKNSCSVVPPVDGWYSVL